MDGQKPLKKLVPNQYRSYRTRYHEIKNFILKVNERAKNGEANGDPRQVRHTLDAWIQLIMVHTVELTPAWKGKALRVSDLSGCGCVLILAECM